MRQLTGGNGAVVDRVVLRAGFVDDSAGKGEGRRRSQDHLIAAEAQPGGPGHIVEASGFERQIISAVRRANMVVIRTAVEREVSGSGRFSCVGIVGRFVRPEYVAFVVDLNRSVQLVNRAFLFLLDGANGVNVAFFLLLRSRQGA